MCIILYAYNIKYKIYEISYLNFREYLLNCQWYQWNIFDKN